MIYMHYLLLFFKNDNFKYIAASQRLAFNSFSLFHIFLSHRVLSYYLFSNSHAQRNITSVIYITYRILWEFLLCYVLHSIRNMYWWTFLTEMFYCYSQQIKSAVAKESWIPYNLIKRAPYFFLGRELLFIDLKRDTHTKKLKNV